MSNSFTGEQLPLARQVLKFLVCLRNTGGKQQEDVLGHEQKALPLVGVKEVGYYHENDFTMPSWIPSLSII